MPFCTTSCAEETALATLGLASNVCGSVLGLLSIALTRTYLPPIWPITLAYWFSAPTATTCPPELVAAEVDEQAAAETPAVTATTASTIPRRDSRESMVKLLQSRSDARGAEAHRLNTNENDNQYEYRGQAVRPLPGRRGPWRETDGRRVAGRPRRGEWRETDGRRVAGRPRRGEWRETDGRRVAGRPRRGEWRETDGRRVAGRRRRGASSPPAGWVV